MNWIFLAIIASFNLSIYNFLMKISSSRIPTTQSIPILTLGTVISGIIIYLIYGNNINNQNIKYSFVLPLVAGIIWAVGQILFFMVFQKGAPLSIGLPFLLGGVILFGSIMGIVLLNEGLNIYKIVGILSIIFGLFIINK